METFGGLGYMVGPVIGGFLYEVRVTLNMSALPPSLPSKFLQDNNIMTKILL